jgi:serine phosphatase RsbU (regulator of sigma subunit)
MDRFVTLGAAVLDPETQTVTLVSAGHPSPLLYSPATNKIEEVVPRDVAGVPLGMLPEQVYGSCQVKLQPGDYLLLFSDGVPDAYNVRNEAFKIDGIYTALEGGGPLSPKGAGERVVKAVKQHAAGRSQHDDITLVCFGRTA